MDPEPPIRYIIDADDRIVYVDPAWSRFAEANDGGELRHPDILGQSLWDHVSDATTRTLYQRIVARVRQGKLARFTLRCDGPACRRLLEMTVRAAPDGSVTFETLPLSIEEREPQVVLSRGASRSTDLLRTCAWCNRVNVGTGTGEWVAVEDATDRLRLFEFRQLPQLTHGICEECLASMTQTLADLEASA